MRKSITINGLLLSYRAGTDGGAPVIFLHGWRSGADAWKPVLDLLANTPYAAYAPDLPGFGASEMPGQAMTLENYAGTVIAFADALGIPRGTATLVGHSFGARIAAKIAAAHPDFARRIILVGSGGNRPNATVRTMKKLIATALKPFFLPSFMRPLRAKIYALIGAEDYVATPTLTETFKNILSEDLTPLFPRITAKTLVIWGEEDGMAPVAYGRTIASAIPGAELKIMKNTGHWCFQDHPEEFTELLLGFLK